jgi:hypothetical protein
LGELKNVAKTTWGQTLGRSYSGGGARPGRNMGGVELGIGEWGEGDDRTWALLGGVAWPGEPMRVEQIPGNRYGILSHASARKDEGGEKRKKLW